MTSRRPHAFSLIEMLVCMAIIGALISLLMPALANARSNSWKTTCQSNLRQLGIGWSVFPADNQNKLVRGVPDDSSGWVRTGPGVSPITAGRLYPYVNSLDVWSCPSDTSGNSRSFSITAPMHGEHWDRHLTSPNDAWAQFGTDDYASILTPGRQMVLMEELDARGWNVGSWIMYVRNPQKYNWIDHMASFHGEGTSIAFADGHVEYWYWEDPDTRYASSHGQFFLYDYRSTDWLRVRNSYRVLPSTSNVSQTVTP